MALFLPPSFVVGPLDPAVDLPDLVADFLVEFLTSLPSQSLLQTHKAMIANYQVIDQLDVQVLTRCD